MKDLEDSKAAKKIRETELDGLNAEVLNLKKVQTSKDQELDDLRNAHAMEVDTLKVQLASL